MSRSAEGGPERLGRLLGQAVVRGRIAARQVADPATREQLAKAGRRAAEQAQPKVQDAAARARQELAARGPDVAEQVTQRAVDRVLLGLAWRSGVLGVAIRPLAQPVRNVAGTLARDLARAAGGGKDPAATPATDTAPPLLPEAAEAGEGPAGRERPSDPTA